MIVGDDVYDAIIGYRIWLAEAFGGHVRLYSPSRRGFEWRRGHVLAECGCDLGHPEREHACGIYAWHKTLVPESPRYIRSMLGQPRYIFGEVALWGTVHVHEVGYRGQYAKPTAFYVTPTMDDIIRQFVGLAAIQWKVPTVLPEYEWEIGERGENDPLPPFRATP